MSRERSVSPTLAIYNGWERARAQRATMVNMGLHVFNPGWQRETPYLGRQYSASFRDITLKILGSSETLTFPVQTCTTVKDIKDALANSLMASSDSLVFIEKRGCTNRQMFDTEEMARNVTVRGLQSFKALPHKYPHPIAILGAGYNGIKTCMLYVRDGDSNIVCFDRHDRVGGYCWIKAANKTSKLQTEFASFHVWWGPDYLEKAGGYPREVGMLPNKAKVLEHFQHAAEMFGILPYVKLQTNIEDLAVVGDKKSESRFYNMRVHNLKDDTETTVSCSAMYSYPGIMCRNRLVTFPGEDIFDGQIGYGMNDEAPYDNLKNSRCAIVGNGAYSIENVRTCCEYGATKVFLITRRKNLPAPRVASWFVHQGPAPTPGWLMLNMFMPMFECGGLGDPWDYWAVHANSSRTTCTLIQSSRFGIGDMTFLAHAYGKLEYVEDTIKRLSSSSIFMMGGQRLEDMSNLIKALGLLGDHGFDKLHNMKEVLGMWCAGDHRRVFNIDALGMNAANFTTYSVGIGAYGMTCDAKFLYDYPREHQKLLENGIMDALPRNKADMDQDRPAYAINVRHAMAASITISSLCPKMGLRQASTGEYKYRLYHSAHPIDFMLRESMTDWDQYQAEWKENGSSHDYIPYPYTKEMISGYFREYNQVVGLQISEDGPPKELPDIACTVLPPIGELPSWANDNNAMGMADHTVNTDHLAWWHEHSAPLSAFKIKQ